MDSPQPTVSPLKTSSDHPKPEKQTAKPYPPREIEINFQRKDAMAGAHEADHLGFLDVYIHQARNVHNICIYQKQDVYAKLYLTSDPERSVSTKIIHGGGHNPVFNEGLCLSVRSPDSSLKCEIWMLSRVRNYMEDQLLGFALVPLSEVLLQGGCKLQKEFSLSSTDLFHTPAGFVELSVSYVGDHPDVIPIPAPAGAYSENESITTLVNDFDRMEFPDPKVVNENHQMVEEYIEICSKPEESSGCAESLVSSDAENLAVQPEESLSTGTGVSSGKLKADSPPSEISSASAEVSFQSSETPKGPNLPAEDHLSGVEEKSKGKSENGLDGKSDESGGVCGDGFLKPLVSVNIEPEPKLVQQDIVDMYMKSMQQFTESLAKMKLPMDYENGPSSSENSTTSDQKTPSSKNSGSRVFYGSRAFF